MNRSGAGISLRICLAALAWFAAGIVVAAAARNTGQDQPDFEELDEVFVDGDRVKRKSYSYKELQKPLDWMARLVGEFDVGGTVILSGPDGGEQTVEVLGHAQCIGFGIGPGVQCDLQVKWPEAAGPDGEEFPGGVSAFDPAALLLGYEPVQGAVSYILVSNKGHAETAVGEMVSGDTMRSRTDCADSVAVTCEQVMRITANRDLETVEMRIERRSDLAPAVRYVFVMRRVSGSQSVVFGRKQGKK